MKQIMIKYLLDSGDWDCHEVDCWSLTDDEDTDYNTGKGYFTLEEAFDYQLKERGISPEEFVKNYKI